MNTRSVYRYRYAILWAIFILFACGAQPGTLAKLRLEDLFGYDKPIHAFLFGMQSWLLIKARLPVSNNSSKTILYACMLSAIYGAGIELLQKWVFVGRSYDYFDMIANTLGCVIVYIIANQKFKHV